MDGKMAKYKWYTDNKNIDKILADIRRESAWTRPRELVSRRLEVNSTTYNYTYSERQNQSAIQTMLVNRNRGDQIDLVDDNRIIKSYNLPENGSYVIESFFPLGQIRVYHLDTHQTWIR